MRESQIGLFLRPGREGVLALVIAIASALYFVNASGAGEILIDPDQESVSATSYYATFGQIPSKMADNSGLSFPLPTGTPAPASDNAYPSHDTALIDMYRSGKDTHPDLFFSLNGAYELSALHYWNFNGDNRSTHPTGGDRETPGDGISTVDIAVSTSSALGPWTTIGTYSLQQALALDTYTGLTLPLGKTVGAKFVRFHVGTNFTSGPDASGYFGMSELRFIGGTFPGDVNLDGVVDFKDLVTIAAHYGTTSGATLAQGDLTGDGKVDFSDLVNLASNYGRTISTSQLAQFTPQFRADVTAAFAQVPEPTAAAVVFLLAAALLLRFPALRRRGAVVAVTAMLAAGSFSTSQAAQIEQQIIDADKENVSASSYYPVVDAAPQKLVDNSGLSSPVNNGDPVPAVWPSHDTVLSDMYFSGAEVAPSLEFTLPGTYAINALHYWNENEAADKGHRDGAARGLQNVTIGVSRNSFLGPYTPVGSFQFQEAPGDPSYTGVTLPLGKTVVARYIQFKVSSNWGGDFSGLSEVRFIGGSQPGDVNLDGSVNFTDLVALASHYGTQSGATLADGDLNRDGKVDFADLVILAQNYGQSLTASQLALLAPQFRADVASAFAQVPEPGALAMLGGIAVLLVVPGRRTCRIRCSA